MSELTVTARAAAQAARNYMQAARARVLELIAPRGSIDTALADRQQRLLHGFAWIATTVEALEATARWATRASDAGRFGEVNQLTLGVGFGEYLAQLLGGIPMSQGEYARPGELGLTEAAAVLAANDAVRLLLI
jgi:(2S)-methylsuccinyl-CoA dehydrogenase